MITTFSNYLRPDCGFRIEKLNIGYWTEDPLKGRHFANIEKSLVLAHELEYKTILKHGGKEIWEGGTRCDTHGFGTCLEDVIGSVEHLKEYYSIDDDSTLEISVVVTVIRSGYTLEEHTEKGIKLKEFKGDFYYDFASAKEYMDTPIEDKDMHNPPSRITTNLESFEIWSSFDMENSVLTSIDEVDFQEIKDTLIKKYDLSISEDFIEG